MCTYKVLYAVFVYNSNCVYFFILIKIIGKKNTEFVSIVIGVFFLVTYVIYCCLENVYESLFLSPEELAIISDFFSLEPEHMGYSKNFHSFRDVLLNFFLLPSSCNIDLSIRMCKKRKQNKNSCLSVQFVSKSSSLKWSLVLNIQ